MTTTKKHRFLVCQKVEICGLAPLFDDQIIKEAKKSNFWFVKDINTMPAKMWAVLNPGHAHQKPWVIPIIRSTRKSAIDAFLTQYGVGRTDGDWDRMKLRGFRVVRVIVEVA